MKSKIGLWALLTGLVLSHSAMAQDSNSSALQSASFLKLEPVSARPFNFTGNWKFDIGGGNAQEGKDTWSAGYLYFWSNLDFKFNSQLRAHILPYGRLYGGRAQERWDDDSLDSRVGVGDAIVAWEPLKVVELKGGIHSQSIVNQPMLVSNLRSFPGAQEIFKAEAYGVTGRLIFQQVIPHSYSLNTERMKQETLPWFKTEHAEIEGKQFGWLEWKAKGGLYEWSDIPSKVAFESIRLGNSGDNATVANSRFNFRHQGWFGGGSLCYCANDSSVNLIGEFDRVHNSRAPGNAADAQMWGLGPKIKWKGTELTVLYHSYFIESDATIAAYNKSRLGNTNRIGHHLEASLHFVDQHFMLYAEMYQAKPINDRDVDQRNMQQFYLGLETDYVSF